MTNARLPGSCGSPRRGPGLEEQLSNQGIWELATTLEFPLVKVLARMEHNGILVDRGYLEKLNSEFGQKMVNLEGRFSGSQMRTSK